MKVKIVCDKDNYSKFKAMLESAGFIISNDANLVFKDEDYQPNQFIAKRDEHYEIIDYKDVVFIESYGREIYLYTEELTYQIKQKLYEIEGEYSSLGFIRINKSQIVNKDKIEKIKPQFNSKIKLVLVTGIVLEISRTYLENFKEIIGF